MEEPLRDFIDLLGRLIARRHIRACGNRVDPQSTNEARDQPLAEDPEHARAPMMERRVDSKPGNTAESR